MATPESTVLRRRWFLAGAALTITGVTAYSLLAEDDVYPPNRWFGVFTPGRDLALLDEVIKPLAKQPSAVGYFVKLNSEFTGAMLEKFALRGLTPFLTLEPWLWNSKPTQMLPELSLKSLNAGTYDEDLRRIAQVVATFNRPVMIRLAHEFNGHWYPWSVGQNGNTAADYIAFWRHVRDIFSIAPHVRWVWATAAMHALRRGAPDIATCWPGDALVDFAGTTGYGWEKDAHTTYHRTLSKIATFTNKDFIIPEMGAQNGVNKAGTPAPQWTASLIPYLRDNPRIRGFVWFHIGAPGEGATGDYRLRDQRVQSALNRVLDEVPIASNTAMRTPTGTLRVGVSPNAAVNPTLAMYSRDVVKGHACDPRKQRFGYDKNGTLYQCWTHPRGWSHWKPVE
ncbi:MAG: glycosyl hydrolase [Propionibacteriaceae bacterium]